MMTGKQRVAVWNKWRSERESADPPDSDTSMQKALRHGRSAGLSGSDDQIIAFIQVIGAEGFLDLHPAAIKAASEAR